MNMLVAVAFTALAVLSALQHSDASAYDKIVYHSRVRARLQGPNVCAMQQVEGTKKKYFSTCRNWYRKTICGKTADVVYECCPGYMKMDGLRGCPAVAPIENVYGTLGTIKATSTQSYSDSAKLRAEIEGSGSYTFFAPSNDAWDALDEEMKSALVSNVNIELYNALHYHMANKRFLTKDLKNGMLVTSMYNDLGLYINHYSNGVVTVNCARIIHGNQVATNGVVHVVDRVVSSVGNSIAEVLDVDDDLTTLTNMARDAGLMEKLGEPGQYTIFAPTNEAFDKLGSDVLERIMSDKDVLKALLNFHLLNTVQCSEGIMLGTSYETLEGNSIEVGCDGDSLTVNGIKMVMKKDIVATNGVIHLIDQVLMPDSAKEVMELLGPSQSTFGDLVGELGLSEALRAESEYTLLAPFNSAFTDDVMDIDQSQLKIMLENHVLKSKVLLGQLYNGQLLETIAGKFLRVFVYRTAVCIENSCLVRGSKEGSNGAIHQMRILMKPAEKDMYEILMEHGGYKIFLSLVESAGLTDMLRQEGDFTLFAPSDKAFRGVSQSDLAILTGDLNALRTILLYHFNIGVFIGGGLEGGVTNLLKSLQGSNLRVLFANNSMQVNTVKVPESDVMATNGVVHFIDSILYPADIPVGSQDLMGLLQRMISYFQIKYIHGFRYQEIPLTFMRKVTRVIERDPAVKKFTRVIQGETRVITEVQPSIKKVTRVIDGQPVVKKVTRVIERDPVVTTVTRLVTGPEPAISRGTSNIDIDFAGVDLSELHTGAGFHTERINVHGDRRRVSNSRRVPGVPRRRE
ncbi:periostin, osteoblast specific factor b isoform X1 [Gadus macrocephalus]|uniref:periostin, osteoblast specific factor b isoform X1 n=1 Tax=Gadus macrocephalus TaxID=80720 RepID=UPI0028CB8D35|nr:periostin, osteoblast specific factor b isoform X1 [Gadus macrocephalus]